MLLKCTCSHCSSHIEFESEHVGSVVTCPVCSKPTKLTLDGGTSSGSAESGGASARAATPAVPTGSQDAALQAVRANTCYRNLRMFVAMLHIAFLTIAGLGAIGSIVQTVVVSSALPPGMRHFPALMLLAAGFFLTALFCLCAFVTKHVLLMLVDIADCQIQQVARGK